MELSQDRTGFPLIRVGALDLGWLPVTKIQFEQFLCETADARFGPRWYDELLSLNPRVAPHETEASNYWRSFVTGVLPEEAESFARWMGEDYCLPTLKEWNEAFDHLMRSEPLIIDWDEMLPHGSRRCRTLLDRVLKAAAAAAKESAYEQWRADQMLMRLGVLEWVEVPGGQRWGGMGEVAPGLAGLLFDPTAGEPHRPYHPESERISFYGFRIVRRAHGRRAPAH